MNKKRFLTSIVWMSEDFNNNSESLKEYWEQEWQNGLILQDSDNKNKFTNWLKESYSYLKEDLKDGYIKTEILGDLLTLLVND